MCLLFVELTCCLDLMIYWGSKVAFELEHCKQIKWF